MELKKIKKLSISNLAFNILNDNEFSLTRKDSEIELKRRIKNLGFSYYDLLDSECKKINIRGNNINNYLISDNPCIQNLMELYFNECYDKKCNDNLLLFSEKHLCNNMNFISRFFDKVCDNQINNLKDNYNLEKFRKVLENRYCDTIEEKNRYYLGTDILTFNEPLTFLKQFDLFKPGNNMTHEQYFNLRSSIFKTLGYELLVGLNNSFFLDNEVFQNLFGLKICFFDSVKLNKQKKILLDQSLNKDSVNYFSDDMKKIYKKL